MTEATYGAAGRLGSEIRVDPPGPHNSDKVRPVIELAAIVRGLQAEGKSVVLAHGAFDLLHLGHVRHLSAAKRFGDVLVVTITADEFINKGPGRPVFNHNLRAEMLSNLSNVDWVGVCFAPDAIELLDTIRPDFYVKGQDYLNPEGDITGKITAERDAVERGGGKLVFTEEITFSSSSLLNRHFNIFEPHVREHLSSLRADGSFDRMMELIEGVSDMRVLIVGEAIVDEYCYVVPMGKSPKENMIAARFQDAERFAGGVIASANHAASFCKQVDVITTLGSTDPNKDLILSSAAPNVHVTTFERKGAPTTRKQRFIDPSYMRKLFEVYFMDDDPLKGQIEDRIDREIKARAGDYDIVIVNDFGHGMITPRMIETLCSSAKFLAINAQSNSANHGYNLITRYPRADYVCIDGPEARLAASDRITPLNEVVSTRLAGAIDCKKFIITQGRHGCVTYEDGELAHTIPALAGKVVDTVGAGDAFLSVTSPLVAAGGQMNLVGFIGNVVGALKVEIVGHRKSVDKVSLLKALTALLK